MGLSGTPKYDLSSYNPFGPHLLEMHDILDYARKTTPIFFSKALNAWCVTTYDDVKAVASDPATFSSRNAFPRTTGLSPEVRRVVEFPFEFPVLTIQDPPDHDRVRRIVHGWFSPRRVAKFEPVIRELIASHVNRLPLDRRFDLVADYAIPISLAVVLRMSGYPEEGYDIVRDFAVSVTTLLVGAANLGEDERDELGRRAIRGYEYIFNLIDERTAEPRDDLISFLIHETVRGQKLTRDEVASVAFIVVTAGWHTTSGAITNTVHALLKAPGLWEALAKGELRTEDAATEGLRYDTSVIGLFRTATRDTRIGDVDIRKGERVFLSYASANHDPAKIARPSEFDPNREDTAQLLHFGHGIHYCIGAPIAKIEMQASLELLAQRYPSLRLADEPVRYEAFNQFKLPEALWLVP